MRKRLKLNKETLRNLDAAHLAWVVGGARSIVNPPPVPTVQGFTCEGLCITLTCLTECGVCETLRGCELG